SSSQSPATWYRGSMAEQRNEPESIPTISAMLPSGDIVEIVYQPTSHRTLLAVGSDKGSSLHDAVDVGDKCLVPWNAENSLIKHEVVLLPSEPEDFGTVASLVADIDA